MNNYCNTCRHKNIPAILKKKYNEDIMNVFIECPMKDKNVIGCLTSNFAIAWQEFFKWEVKRKGFTDGELKNLAKKGWKISS